MKKVELRCAADLLCAILARVEAGELTAPARVVARLEGAATVLEAVARPTSGGQSATAKLTVLVGHESSAVTEPLHPSVRQAADGRGGAGGDGLDYWLTHFGGRPTCFQFVGDAS
jgi:hypothetical protein